MRDIFTELAAAWTGEAAAVLAARPIPDRQFVPIPDEEPSTPPGGRSWFEVLTAHWADPDVGMSIAVEAHQRDLARVAQAPVLNVSVGEETSTRYRVDAEHGVVAYTVAPLRSGLAPGSAHVPKHRVRPARSVVVRHRPRPGMPVAMTARLDEPASQDDVSTDVLPAVSVTDPEDASQVVHQVSQVAAAWEDWYSQ